MRSVLAFFSRILRFHKSKIALFFVLTLIFVFVLFPYRDLSSLVTNQVAKMSNNQVFVTFRDMGFSLIPQPGLKLENVYVESATLPPLRSESLTFRPGLWNFPAGTLLAEGFLGGEALVQFQTKSRNDSLENHIELSLQDITLRELAQLYRSAPGQSLPMVEGSLSADMDLSIPQNAPQNISGVVDLSLQNFLLPTFSMTSGMGPIDVPSLRLSQLQANAEIKNGVVQIQEMEVGAPGDSVSGTIRGTLTLGPARGGQGMTVAAYDLNLNLTFSQEFLGQPGVSLFIGLIDGYQDIGARYRHPTSGGVRYAFRISGSGQGSMPRISAPST